MEQEHDPKRDTLREILNDILAEKEEASTIEELSDEISLTENLELDSLDLAEMTVRLEDRYGVDVFEEEVIDEVHEVLDKLES